jgi:hypothetical protein
MLPRDSGVSKVLYVGVVLIGYGTSIFGPVIYITGTPPSARPHLTAVAIGSLAAACIATGFIFALFFKAWSAIQHASPRMKPLRGTLLLLLPIFNIYWSFQYSWGLARDYNSYSRIHSANLPKLPEGVFLALPPLAALYFFARGVPDIGPLYSLTMLLVWVSVTSRLCECVNGLAAHRKES